MSVRGYSFPQLLLVEQDGSCAKVTSRDVPDSQGEDKGGEPDAALQHISVTSE